MHPSSAPPPPFVFLADPDAVAEQIDRLAAAPMLAVDLEADGLHSYRDKICLVQVSTAAANVILDPLACPRAVPALLRVLADPGVHKVFHGGDYDVRLLRREPGAEVRNLFDTMVAAQLTGRGQFGLAALLEEAFGVKLDKRFQRADWSMRPLSPEMLAYAALDTAHLFALRERLEGELRALGRLAWAEEEFRLMEDLAPSLPKAPWCLDVKGAGRLAPRQLAVLQALLEMRDGLARERDRPPFKVCGNDLLLAWAQNPPKSRQDVLATPGANRPMLERLADGVLAAAARGLALPDEECPRPQFTPRSPITPAQERRLVRLKKERAAAAARLKLAPGLIVNTANLERFSREDPEQAAALMEATLKRWQLEAIGDRLRRALEERPAGGHEAAPMLPGFSPRGE